MLCEVTHRGFYHYDPRQQHLWIVPPRCGSHSFAEYFSDEMIRYDGVRTHPWESCYIITRHPWERIISALALLEEPLTLEAIKRNLDDIHLKPLYKWIGARWGKARPVSLEHMSTRFPGYPKRNHRSHPEWQETAIDWKSLTHVYEKDFKLCQRA